jgi:beta-lactamase regulating signal transducer with metallopeptidase domain
MNSLVLALLIKSSFLIGIAFAINRLALRNRSAASRHLVWTLALSGVLLLPMLSVAVPGLTIPIRVGALTPQSVSGPTVVLDEPEASVGAAPASASAPITESRSAEAPRAETSWGSVALAIYAAGVLLLGLRLALGRWTLSRIVCQSTEVQDPAWRAVLRECEVTMGVNEPVRLLRSLDRSMPMAFGLRTPTILIPAIADTWSDDRRRAVLLHELAHIDRRDCLTQLLAEVTCAAYWMHPAVWLVAERLKVEREVACDDRVLTVGTAAGDYAGHLLELAYSLGGYRSPALVVSMARRGQLEGRMLAVLDAARNRVTPTLRARVVGLVATALLVLPLAAAEAVIVPESSEAPEMTLAPTPPEPAGLKPLAPLAPLPPFEHSERTEKRREIQLPGTFEVRASEEAGTIYLQLSDRPNSMHGFSLAVAQLEGFSPSILTGEGGSAKFSLRRDAGTITFEGIFRSGVGAGTFDFSPDAAFPGAMAKRGFEAPNKTEQYQLARGDIGFAYLDELKAQNYERPTLAELIRAADHGVHFDYLRGMGGAGYKLGRLDALVRTRDHGVTLKFIVGLAAAGIKDLSADELVRARDHGVTPEYIGTMRALGYKDLSLQELIRTRDHGVNADYIRGMAEAGYAHLTLSELVRTRDSGVGPEYVKALRDAGHKGLSLQELVKARNHGVGADFVREMAALSRVPLMMEDLINARDHGVGPEFVKAMRELGYTDLALDDLVRLRDHGVSAEFVREQNAGPRGRLSVDELVRRRSRGL